MNIFSKIWTKIKRKWTKIRLQPIRVFCFHHVSDEYDPLTMWECDWTSTSMFKQSIENLRRHGYVFVSLQQAQSHLKNDWFRFKKYAVLTADDGYKSLKNILPWLEKEKIPITLFINAHYMDGKSWSIQQEEQSKRVQSSVDMLALASQIYLSYEEIAAFTSPLVSIASHGYDHSDATKQTISEFKYNVSACVKLLELHPCYIPYHAFTWGRATNETVSLLQTMQLTPVFCSGADNYNNPDIIDRKAIDGKQL